MAIAISKPRAKGIEPSPPRAQMLARSALSNRFQVSHRHAPSNNQMPHLRNILRTKVSGPVTASNVASAPKNSVHSSGLLQPVPAPNARSAKTPAASRITMISNAPQPISCNTLSKAGNSAPLLPRLSFKAAMLERPVSLPITATAPSNSTPTAVPQAITSNAPLMPNPGASKAPSCKTIKPIPRENHRENMSRAPSTRWSAPTLWCGE